MKLVSFVCLFLWVTVPLFAQSNPVPTIDYPLVRGRTSRRIHTAGLPPLGSPAIRQQGGATGLEGAAPRHWASQTPALAFEPAATYSSGGAAAVSVTIADVNGDGKPDLLVANNNSSTVGVLLGNGDGTFKAAVTYSGSGDVTNSVAVADVNGDGKPDLVLTNLCGITGCANDPNGTVAVLLGNGDGTFQTAITYGSGGYYADSVAVADVNGDGKLDLLVGNRCDPSGCTVGTVGVLLGNGNGTFQSAVALFSGGYEALSVAVADVNGDGKPDLLVANYCLSFFGNCGGSNSGAVGVLLGNGDGTFKSAVSYGSGGQEAYSVAVADVNGDGKPDLLLASISGAGVLLGNGDGTFQTAVVYPTGESPVVSVAVGDVNGDGKPDLLAANQCVDTSCASGSVGVLLGNGDGTFQTAVNYGSGGQYTVSVAVGDVNGDGKPDILLANECLNSTTCTNGVLGVLINMTPEIATTSLVSSPNPSGFGQAVTLTATVTPHGKGTPTGTVTFSDGTNTLGSSSLNGSGVAALSISTLTVGTHSITAAYGGDANFAASTSPVLSQVVQGAIATLSPTSLNFGNQTVGSTSMPQNVTLTNTGNVALNISDLRIIGTNTTDFAQTNNCGTSVAAGSSCNITVTFTPSSTAARNAAVSITDNAPSSPQTVPLTGTGVVPAVTFSSTSLTFPTEVIFTTSKTQTVKLTNTGLGVLTVTSIVASGPFAQTNTCNTPVNPGANCTINVTFKPTTKGSITGSVSVTDNASGSPQKIALKGTGTYVQLAPTNLNFGNQPVGTKSLPKKITLTNKGSVAVSIFGLSITGADAGDFAQTNTCGTSVAAGASCFIKVTFTPSATGSRAAVVSISDNGGGSPQKVSLAGTGT